MEATQNKMSLILIFMHFFFYTSAQKDYNALYREMNPALEISDPEIKKSIHLDFLEEGLALQDTFKIILGSMYLGNDYVIESNYSKALEHFIVGADYATAVGDTLWLGRINHKKGLVFSLIQNYKEGIDQYELALDQNIIAGDSQYIGITMEQLGALYSYTLDFETSRDYYKEAIPLVERFRGPKALSTTYSNYGNALIDQGLILEAIEAYKKAIVAGKEATDPYRITPAKQNLAFAYLSIDSIQKAHDLYKECKVINEANGWLDFLVYTYDGLSMTHEKMGNTDSALYYFKKHHLLEDSIFGIDVQSEMNNLQLQNEVQKRDNELQGTLEKVYNQKRTIGSIILGTIFLLIILSSIVWTLYSKSQKSKKQLLESRSTLNQLKEILTLKNSEVNTLRNDLKGIETLIKNDQVTSLKSLNLFEFNILTESDWQTFKSFFEKSHPKYLQKIRTTFPNISSAEERLFALIKLNLTNKEAARILGVQTETIKKTRSRLKKRLGLGPNEKLNDFINAFS
jgi:tetratricopeptide (TPR) repeat protein